MESLLIRAIKYRSQVFKYISYVMQIFVVKSQVFPILKYNYYCIYKLLNTLLTWYISHFCNDSMIITKLHYDPLVFVPGISDIDIIFYKKPQSTLRFETWYKKMFRMLEKLRKIQPLFKHYILYSYHEFLILAKWGGMKLYEIEFTESFFLSSPRRDSELHPSIYALSIHQESIFLFNYCQRNILQHPLKSSISFNDISFLKIKKCLFKFFYYQICLQKNRFPKANPDYKKELWPLFSNVLFLNGNKFVRSLYFYLKDGNAKVSFSYENLLWSIIDLFNESSLHVLDNMEWNSIKLFDALEYANKNDSNFIPREIRENAVTRINAEKLIIYHVAPIKYPDNAFYYVFEDGVSDQIANIQMNMIGKNCYFLKKTSFISSLCFNLRMRPLWLKMHAEPGSERLVRDMFYYTFTKLMRSSKFTEWSSSEYILHYYFPSLLMIYIYFKYDAIASDNISMVKIMKKNEDQWYKTTNYLNQYMIMKNYKHVNKACRKKVKQFAIKVSSNIIHELSNDILQ